MPKTRKMRAAAIRIQKVGKTKVKASPIATAIPVVTKKANMEPTKTESALNLQDKVMTAICVLSPNSANATRANGVARAAKLIGEEKMLPCF